MPHGELFIKTHKIVTGRGTDGYIDAYARYGLSLENGAMSKLLVEPGNKEPAGNSNAITPGVSCIGNTIGVKNERNISLEAHICASSELQFIARLELFNEEVLRLDRGEFIRIKTRHYPHRVFRVLYQDFQQFTTFNMEMAMFAWMLKEPHPELRDAVEPNYRWPVVAVVEKDSDLDALMQVTGLLVDGDLAVVTNPTSGNAGNKYLRLFEEDGAPQGGPIWSIFSDEPQQEGDYVKNIIDGSYWRFIYSGSGDNGTWKKHWY